MLRARQESLSILFRNRVPSSHSKGINRILSSPSSLFTAGRDGLIREWDPSCSSKDLEEPRLKAVYDGHSHWVNDIQLDLERELSTSYTVFSASSDCRVIVWSTQATDIQTRSPLVVLDQHIDYLQTIKYCPQAKVLFSGGQDGYLLCWPMDSPTQSQFNRVFNSRGLSIWSLDSDETGNIIGATFASKTPKILDRRQSENQVVELKGHSEHVRKIRVSPDGKTCITSSSDTHVILWDIGEQRSITTFSLHNDSVFALWVSEDFSRAYTGGKDKMVFETDLRTGVSNHLFDEENPVLDICPRDDELWISTPASHFRAFHRNTASRAVRGLPSMSGYSINDNKKIVVTKNTDALVEVWDILQGKVVKTFPGGNMEEVAQSYNTGKVNPSWFSVSLHLGSLMIDISHSDAANCEEETSHGRVNFAATLLKKVFHYWIREREKLDFGTPLSENTPPLFCDEECGLEDALLLVSSSTSMGSELNYRKYVSQAGDDPKLEEMPRWVQSLIYMISIPRLQNEQMTFTVEPLEDKELPKLQS